MNTRAKFLSVCAALLMIALACKGFTNVSPGEEENLVQEIDPPVVPQATATPVVFDKAVFYYFPDGAVFSGVESVGSLSDFCSPPNIAPNDTGSGYLDITPLGFMEGYCKGENPDKTLHREGDFEGNYYSGGATVSFRVKLVKVFTPHPGGKWTATLRVCSKIT